MGQSVHLINPVFITPHSHFHSSAPQIVTDSRCLCQGYCLVLTRPVSRCHWIWVFSWEALKFAISPIFFGPTTAHYKGKLDFDSIIDIQKFPVRYTLASNWANKNQKVRMKHRLERSCYLHTNLKILDRRFNLKYWMMVAAIKIMGVKYRAAFWDNS